MTLLNVFNFNGIRGVFIFDVYRTMSGFKIQRSFLTWLKMLPFEFHGSATLCVYPPPWPPFSIILFLSTTLLTRMAGISLHGVMASDFSAVWQFSPPEQLTFRYGSISWSN
jgi:hypothetical protein